MSGPNDGESCNPRSWSVRGLSSDSVHFANRPRVTGCVGVDVCETSIGLAGRCGEALQWGKRLLSWVGRETMRFGTHAINSGFKCFFRLRQQSDGSDVKGCHETAPRMDVLAGAGQPCTAGSVGRCRTESCVVSGGRGSTVADVGSGANGDGQGSSARRHRVREWSLVFSWLVLSLSMAGQATGLEPGGACGAAA